MKKFIYVFTLVYLIFTSCTAQKSILDTSKQKPSTQLENALLWKIEGKDLKQPSYLFGTIHMIGKEDFFLTDATKEMFGKTDRVTFEINMEEMNDIGAQLSLMMNAFMKDNLTLKDLLSEEDYDLVGKHFKEMGLPLFMLERIKPMFLSVFASGDMDMSGLQNGSMVSYEMKLMDMAKEQNKEIGGLETAEYQMSMFDSIPYTAQADMLVESIKAGDQGDEQFKNMVELYKNQNLQAMGKMISSDAEGIANYEELLLKNRNRNWIPVMGKMMLDKPTFFAVGAGHLAGEHGVINLLRKEGYKVTAVDPVKTKP